MASNEAAAIQRWPALRRLYLFAVRQTRLPCDRRGSPVVWNLRSAIILCKINVLLKGLETTEVRDEKLAEFRGRRGAFFQLSGAFIFFGLACSFCLFDQLPSFHQGSLDVSFSFCFFDLLLSFLWDFLGGSIWDSSGAEECKSEKISSRALQRVFGFEIRLRYCRERVL